MFNSSFVLIFPHYAPFIPFLSDDVYSLHYILEVCDLTFDFVLTERFMARVTLKGPTVGGKGHSRWEKDRPCRENLGMESLFIVYWKGKGG